jgi:predicted RNase H-like nuclease (RuvC/YqgF family)
MGFENVPSWKPKHSHELEFYEENEEELLEDIEQDDMPSLLSSERKLEQLFELMNRLGGEVCRLRAEVDGLQEEQAFLIKTLKSLRQTIHEKGLINMDDFDLACEIYEDKLEGSFDQILKKVSH